MPTFINYPGSYYYPAYYYRMYPYGYVNYNYPSHESAPYWQADFKSADGCLWSVQVGGAVNQDEAAKKAASLIRQYASSYYNVGQLELTNATQLSAPTMQINRVMTTCQSSLPQTYFTYYPRYWWMPRWVWYFWTGADSNGANGGNGNGGNGDGNGGT